MKADALAQGQRAYLMHTGAEVIVCRRMADGVYRVADAATLALAVIVHRSMLKRKD